MVSGTLIRIHKMDFNVLDTVQPGISDYPMDQQQQSFILACFVLLTFVNL